MMKDALDLGNAGIAAPPLETFARLFRGFLPWTGGNRIDAMRMAHEQIEADPDTAREHAEKLRAGLAYAMAEMVRAEIDVWHQGRRGPP